MSGFQAIWDLFSKHEHKAFIQYIPEVKRIRDNKINKVAAGGGGGVNMTLQKQGASERDQHDSSQKPNGRWWRISSKFFYYPFSFTPFLLSCYLWIEEARPIKPAILVNDYIVR